MAKNTAYKVEFTRTTLSGNILLYYWEKDMGTLRVAIKEIKDYAEDYGLTSVVSSEKILNALNERGYYQISRARSFDVVFAKITKVYY